MIDRIFKYKYFGKFRVYVEIFVGFSLQFSIERIKEDWYFEIAFICFRFGIKHNKNKNELNI